LLIAKGAPMVKKNYIFERLERLTIFVCASAICFGSYLLWESHKFNSRAAAILEKHEMRIGELYVKQQEQETQHQIAMSKMQNQLAIVRAEMLSREDFKNTLKSIELFLYSHPEPQRGKMVGKALNMVIESNK